MLLFAYVYKRCNILSEIHHCSNYAMISEIPFGKFDGDSNSRLNVVKRDYTLKVIG